MRSHVGKHSQKKEPADSFKPVALSEEPPWRPDDQSPFRCGLGRGCRNLVSRQRMASDLSPRPSAERREEQITIVACQPPPSRATMQRPYPSACEQARISRSDQLRCTDSLRAQAGWLSLVPRSFGQQKKVAADAGRHSRAHRCRGRGKHSIQLVMPSKTGTR